MASVSQMHQNPDKKPHDESYVEALLLDNEWHKLKDIQQKIADFIPPEEALRKHARINEVSKAYRQKKNPGGEPNHPGGVPPAEGEAAIASGKKALVRMCLFHMEDAGMIERHDDSVRLTQLFWRRFLTSAQFRGRVMRAVTYITYLRAQEYVPEALTLIVEDDDASQTQIEEENVDV